MSCFEWTLIDEADSERATTMTAVRDLLSSHPSSTLDHDPDWLTATAKSRNFSVRLYVCQNAAGDFVGYAPFLIHPSAFEFSYAGYTLWRYRTRRYTITTQPLLRLVDKDVVVAGRALVNRLRRDLGRHDVLFVLGLHLDSAFGKLIASGDVKPGFQLMAHGPAYQRRLARVEKTLDEYLSKLGSKTRQDLRRQERRLQKHTDNGVGVSICSNPESIDEFLEAVEHISRRTYQWNLLGIRIKKDEEMSELLRDSAENGWLRGYVLHAQGQPVAFMIGHVYRGTYLSQSIGFDPDWAKWSVGNVLHLHVMRDLSALGEAVEWFDFMYGDNSNKERLSTNAHFERNYYLIPSSPRWRVLISALKGFDGMTAALSGLLERQGIKGKIRRALRRRATRAARQTRPGD